MVGKWLIQGVAKVPAVGQVEPGRLDQLALGADALEEHDQLELEEDDRVDTGAAALGVEVLDPFADEAQVELRIEVAVEVAPWNQVLQRDGDRCVEAAGFARTEHDAPLLSGWLRGKTDGPFAARAQAVPTVGRTT